MPRKPRQDKHGAVHHIIVRGVARTAVVVDEDDYAREHRLLERTVSRFELTCHAWCFMPNHSHLLVTSRKRNISSAMQWFGSRTAQTFNSRYERSGHLYQGRFGSRLVENDRYFLELARYLPLNPSRAGLCRAPEDWLWSSYSATVGLRACPTFLDPSALIEKLGSADAYVGWVAAGAGSTFLDEQGVPRPPARPSLASLLPEDSDSAVAIAYHGHGYTMNSIAKYLGVSRSQISRRLSVHV